VIANIVHGRHPYNYAPHVREYTPQEVTKMGEQAGFVLEWTKTFAPWQVYSREFLDALSATLKRIIVEVRNPGNDAMFVFRKP